MSDIDRYLDEMFDRVAGQGAAGRRMLEEAEGHLRAAAADGIERGLPPEQAERDAVATFGEPSYIAALLRQVHGTRLAVAVSGASVVTGFALIALAISYLLAACGLAVWSQGNWGGAACGMFDGECGGNARVIEQTGTTGILLLLIGAATLVVRRWAIRAGRLVPKSPPYALLGAVALALVGVLVLVDLPLACGLFFYQVGLLSRATLFTTCAAAVNVLAVGAVQLAPTWVRKRITRRTSLEAH